MQLSIQKISIVWASFWEFLYQSVRGNNGSHITFMTDKQKALLISLEQQWSRATTKYCARHIYINFKLQWSRLGLKKLLWQAKAINEKHFELAMEKIKTLKKVSLTAYAWLAKIPPNEWSRLAFDTTLKIVHTTNNCTECLNVWINIYRDKLVLILMEYIRRKFMTKPISQYVYAQAWSHNLPLLCITSLLKLSNKERNWWCFKEVGQLMKRLIIIPQTIRWT